MSITVRNVTPAECRAFGVQPLHVNWGVIYRDEIAAIFRAEDAGDGCLAVHANVRRHTLHPAIVAAYAKSFCDQLLERAESLTADILANNRAAIRLAKAAGLVEQNRNNNSVSLYRYGNGRAKTGFSTV